jgi:type IV pilus assembly protein PilV
VVSCRSEGFTLIEVLVAALLLAIAILGSMAAQLHALRTRQGSALMSSAVQLAGGIAERMRANGRFSDRYLGLDYDALRDGAPAAEGSGCHAAPCSGAELAAHDLDQIRHAVHAGFPGGRVVVCRGAGAGWPCSGAGPLAIKIGWAERGVERSAEARLAVVLVADGGLP